MRQANEPPIARKLTVRAHDRKLVLVKRPWESERHVLLKALVFGRYAGTYPDLRVEVSIGHRYKPDLVALDPEGQPRFWAECGVTATSKIQDLLRAFPHTHFVITKQGSSLTPVEAAVRAALTSIRRTAPVELLRFPDDASWLIDADGNVAASYPQCEIVVIGPDLPKYKGRRSPAGR